MASFVLDQVQTNGLFGVALEFPRCFTTIGRSIPYLNAYCTMQ